MAPILEMGPDTPSSDDGLDPTERAVVLRAHLQEWQTALRWCHGHLAAQDLSASYRDGRNTPKPSRLTNLVARAHDRIEGYLNDNNDGSSDVQTN